MTEFKGFFSLKKKAYKRAVNGYIPKSVIIPLRQDFKEDCKLLVNLGDSVEEGHLIARFDRDGKNPSTVFSPVPGIVENIELSPSPDGFYSKAVRIRTFGKFKFLGKKKSEVDWKSLTSYSVKNSISEFSIMNTFNTSKPSLLSDEIDEFINLKQKIIVVRLFDDDVTRISDSLISEFFLKEVLEGAEILKKAANAERIVFALDKKFAKKDEIALDSDFKTVCFDSAVFPNGFEENLIFQIRKVLTDEKYQCVSKKDLFVDSSTLLELYRCIKFNMPVIDRYVHVSGSCIPVSGMIKVPLGTTIRFLAEQCGGFIKQPCAVIVNGLVSGFSSSSLDSPVTKYVKSVTFIPFVHKPLQKASECIRCGSCRRVCPLNLYPDILYRHVSGGAIAQIEYLKTAQFCSDCGLCNSYCPSRLPISQKIAEIKKNFHYNSGEEK